MVFQVESMSAPIDDADAAVQSPYLVEQDGAAGGPVACRKEQLHQVTPCLGEGTISAITGESVLYRIQNQIPIRKLDLLEGISAPEERADSGG